MKVLISGWYGNGNLGDEAILDAIIADVKAVIPNAEITVLSSHPAHTLRFHTEVSAAYQPPLGALHWLHAFVRRGETSILQTFRAFRECDIFLLGGGGFVADWQADAPRRWLRQLHWAKRQGAITMVYAVGAGPIETEKGRTTVRDLIQYADVITVRDQGSFEAIKQCGVSKDRIEITADPVWGRYVERSHTHDNGRILAILQPYFHLARLWPNMEDRRVKFICALRSWLKETLEFADVDLLPFMEVDRIFLQEFFAGIDHQQTMHKVRTLSCPDTFDEAINVMSQYRVVLSMRYHGIILSIMSCKPTIGIITHHKHNEVLKKVDLTYLAQFLGDGRLWPHSDIDPQDLVSTTQKAFNQLEEYRPNEETIKDLKNAAMLNRKALEQILVAHITRNT